MLFSVVEVTAACSPAASRTQWTLSCLPTGVCPEAGSARPGLARLLEGGAEWSIVPVGQVTRSPDPEDSVQGKQQKQCAEKGLTSERGSEGWSWMAARSLQLNGQRQGHLQPLGVSEDLSSLKGPVSSYPSQFPEDGTQFSKGIFTASGKNADISETVVPHPHSDPFLSDY